MNSKPHGAETPRVDAVTLAPSHRDVALQYVPADFARTLERELAAATQAKEKAEAECAELRHALDAAVTVQLRMMEENVAAAESEAAALREEIAEHNLGCRQSCAAQKCGYLKEDGTLIYGTRNCPTCPQDWLIGEQQSYPPLDSARQPAARGAP